MTRREWVVAEFATVDELVRAIEALRARGHYDLDGHTPFPVEAVEDALGVGHSRVPLLVLMGGLIGACGGYTLQWWCNAVAYRLNVGGRPLNSFWSFIPITFELGVLLGSFGAFFGLLALIGHPRLYHPVFHAERFRSASQDRFWVSLHTLEPDEGARAEEALTALGAAHVLRYTEPTP
jgi:hypothetical protein